MIISHEYKLIFITTPKSGSHTGFKLMTDYFDSIETKFNHRRSIPCGLHNYKIFSLVRNPYERFCALYHACVINDRKPFIPKKIENINQYAQWLAQLNTYPRQDLCAPQWRWHQSTRVNEFVQIEHAESIFNYHYPKLNIKMPHELKRTHPTWKDVKNPLLIEYVNKWAGNDFEYYGYERENINS